MLQGQRSGHDSTRILVLKAKAAWGCTAWRRAKAAAPPLAAHSASRPAGASQSAPGAHHAARTPTLASKSAGGAHVAERTARQQSRLLSHRALFDPRESRAFDRGG